MPGCYNPAEIPERRTLAGRVTGSSMGFILGLLDNPYVPWIVGLVALILGYSFLSNRVRIRVPGVPVSGEDLLSRILGPRFAQKKLEREVARLKKQDNYLAAGKILEDAGRLAEAAEAYLEGQEYWAAAASFEKLGRAERAAELYLQAGDHKKGAALFTSAGKPARAAALFLEKGNNLEAARLFGLAGQWGTAAELYEKSGYPLRAAEAWAKARRAAEGRRGLREALHRERVVLHDVLARAAGRPPTTRARSWRASSTRRPVAARPGGRRVRARAATTARRPRPCCASGSPRRRPSSSCGPRTTRRPRPPSSRPATPSGRPPCGERWPSRPTARPRPRPSS